MSENDEYDVETRLLLAEVELGLDARQFVESKVGRFLIGRSNIEIKSAEAELRKVDPEDSKAVRALQNRIWIAERVQIWMAEAINNGANAEFQVNQQQDISGA